MTMLKPTLRLDRLYVSKSGMAAYDEVFHDGINIIRGQNGSGKSTISEFIRYALGANLQVWKKEASLCDFVIAQVSLNGSPVCFRRDVSQERMRPMSIYWGTFEDAVKDLKNWEIYPYARSADKKSFSQRIFEALGLPELRGEFGENITLHQLTRLFYVDQRTQYSDIFVEDGDFDSSDKRGAVADYLCGIFIDDLYNSKLEKRRLEDDLARNKHELSSLTKILAGSNSALGKDAFDSEIKNTKAELEKKNLELEAISENNWQVEKETEKVTKVQVKKLEKEIVRLRRQIRQQSDKQQALEFEVEDSFEFVKHLKESVSALDQSNAVSQYLGVAQFETCPACFNSVAPKQAHVCTLCGSEVNLEKVSLRNQRLKTEISFQLKESEALQQNRHKELDRLEAQIEADQNELTNLERDFRVIHINLISSSEKSIARVSQEIGYLQRQLEDLGKQATLASRIGALDDEIARLKGAISKVDTKIAGYQQQQSEKKKLIYTTISDKTVELLHNDLDREETFKNAQQVIFDFREGKIFTVVEAVTDSFRTREFSASSMVYLKNSFHLALHYSSLALDFMRYPRFTLFDNIEDKGMEVERSQNFQKQIVQLVRNSKITTQIIFTTSMIAPELNIPEYTVGEYYTKQNKTLKGFTAPVPNKPPEPSSSE